MKYFDEIKKTYESNKNFFTQEFKKINYTPLLPIKLIGQNEYIGFCATCGSQMFWDGLGDNLSIFAGCFDGATGVTISGHIFCADKGDYYEITDGLAQADDTALTAKFYS